MREESRDRLINNLILMDELNICIPLGDTRFRNIDEEISHSKCHFRILLVSLASLTCTVDLKGCEWTASRLAGCKIVFRTEKITPQL